jgi:hypothetical protein
MFVVRKRNGLTLIPLIIKQNIKEGSSNTHGYQYFTVNHSKNKIIRLIFVFMYAYFY